MSGNRSGGAMRSGGRGGGAGGMRSSGNRSSGMEPIRIWFQTKL